MEETGLPGLVRLWNFQVGLGWKQRKFRKQTDALQSALCHPNTIKERVWDYFLSDLFGTKVGWSSVDMGKFTYLGKIWPRNSCDTGAHPWFCCKELPTLLHILNQLCTHWISNHPLGCPSSSVFCTFDFMSHVTSYPSITVTWLGTS